MAKKPDKKPIEQYDHKGKERCPPVGLVNPETDKEGGKKTYSYDPHPDPTLIRAGKTEHTSFDIPTVSLRVHERIDPRTIIESAQKRKSGVELDRNLFPQQFFFPLSVEKDGWVRLVKNLKAEIDEERIEAYRGTVSLPFDARRNGRIAVKIVDDRGIESLKKVEIK